MPDTPGTVKYPTALDSADSLIRFSNRAATVLTAALGIGDTTATVSSTGSFPASGVLTIADERIAYTGKTGTTFTGLVRAFDGSTAATASVGAAVRGNYIARHHNALADAIIALQTKLGIGTAISADLLADGTTIKAFLATERTKLAGVASGATANSSDATLLNRANHTGTQAESTVTNLVSDLAAKAADNAVVHLTGNETIAGVKTFSSSPIAPTPADGTNSTLIATTAFVQAALTALTGGAPGALDTLNELAAALGNDANYAATIANALALKAPKASPVFTGQVTFADGQVQVASTGQMIFATGANVLYFYTGTSGLLINNAGNTAQLLSLSNSGNLVVTGTIQGASVTGGDLTANASTAPTLYFGGSMNLTRRGTGIASLGTGARDNALGTLLLQTLTASGVISGNGSGLTNLASSQITDFTEAAQDAVLAVINDTSDLDATYDDAGNAETIVIKNDAVTYAKMQNVSATDKLLGRASTGAGDVEEIPCTAAGRALLAGVNPGVGLPEAFNFIVDGGGSVITTGWKGSFYIPYNCTVNAISNHPIDPATGNALGSITASIAKAGVAVGASTALSAGDWLDVNVSAVTGAKLVTLLMTVTRT